MRFLVKNGRGWGRVWVGYGGRVWGVLGGFGRKSEDSCEKRVFIEN